MKTVNKIKIGNKWVGEGKPCFIIAEAGINHNGNVNIAKKMVDVAKSAKADCIKFQTFKAKKLIADENLTYTYKSQGKKITEPQIKMLQRYEFSEKEWKEIIDYCKKKKIVFSTTAQNISDLDFILSLVSLPFIKIGSDDLTNLDLIEYYAKKKKTMIISAGMAYASEIKDAVSAIRKSGNNNIIVLHCISSYPASAEEVNLKRIKTIKDSFKIVVGFSDHAEGILASVGAVVLGAKVVEKHFTLNKNMSGPDHWFSADPEELKELVEGIRFIEKSLGSPLIFPTRKEKGMRKLVRRSIVATKNIKRGEKIKLSDVECKRPGTGLPPRFAGIIKGKEAIKDIKKGELITLKKLK
ncbi:N-acetylneuraminate synthase family protein [Patescibacteria group bacterium]|nr:N-acetylneuraminate synthase family protein [Patescibacteria group bacterium]